MVGGSSVGSAPRAPPHARPRTTHACLGTRAKTPTPHTHTPHACLGTRAKTPTPHTHTTHAHLGTHAVTPTHPTPHTRLPGNTYVVCTLRGRCKPPPGVATSQSVWVSAKSARPCVHAYASAADNSLAPSSPEGEVGERGMRMGRAAWVASSAHTCRGVWGCVGGCGRGWLGGWAGGWSECAGV